jgi:hypothetical protein
MGSFVQVLWRTEPEVERHHPALANRGNPAILMMPRHPSRESCGWKRRGSEPRLSDLMFRR